MQTQSRCKSWDRERYGREKEQRAGPSRRDLADGCNAFAGLGGRERAPYSITNASDGGACMQKLMPQAFKTFQACKRPGTRAKPRQVLAWRHLRSVQNGIFAAEVRQADRQ
eukprot:jgi/Ulvmu1/7570/UM037_0114.1